jgi:hypothetical protein
MSAPSTGKGDRNVIIERSFVKGYKRGVISEQDEGNVAAQSRFEELQPQIIINSLHSKKNTLLEKEI